MGDFDFLDPGDLVLDALDGLGGTADAEGAGVHDGAFETPTGMDASKEEILGLLSDIEGKLNAGQMVVVSGH